MSAWTANHLVESTLKLATDRPKDTAVMITKTLLEHLSALAFVLEKSTDGRIKRITPGH